MIRTYTIVIISDTITNLSQSQNKYVDLQFQYSHNSKQMDRHEVGSFQ